MPYIEDKNLLFIHIPKNAGKSIDVALGLVSPDDLGKIGQRSVMNRAITLAQRLCTNKFSRKKLYGTHDYTLCTQHLTLQEIQLLNLIPTERWPSIKSFAVFREPLARTVSTFMHFIGNGSATSKEFERFCFSWYSEHSNDHNIIVHRRRQIDFILDCRGRVGVDRPRRAMRPGSSRSTTSRRTPPTRTTTVTPGRGRRRSGT